MSLPNAAMNTVDQARRAAAAGNPGAARKLYRQAIGELGAHPQLLLELGIAEAQAGDFKAARRSLEKAQKQAPDDPNINYNLAHIARSGKQYDRAIALFERSLKADPSNNDAVYGIGEALFVKGLMADALPHLERAAAAAPNDDEICQTLGLVNLYLNRMKEASAVFGRIVARSPGFSNAKLGLAIALAQLDEHRRSLELLAEAERSGTIPASLCAKVAEIYFMFGDLEKAERHARQAIEDDCDVASAETVLGQIAARLGDFDGAEQHYRAAIAADPNCGGAYSFLGAINRLDDGAERRIEKIVNESRASANDRIFAGFALYKLKAGKGSHDDAFAALRLANDLQGELATHDPERQKTLAEANRSVFSPAFLAGRAGQGYDAEGAVFIVGMPRSGTTLTEQLLAVSPEVNPGGERRDISELRRTVPGFPANAGDLGPDWPREAGKRVHAAMVPDGFRFGTDKLPGNYGWLGLIKWILPNARIVYCRRDPCDNALSIYEQSFGRNLPYSTKLDTIASTYRQHLDLMHHWRETCGIEVHEVVYEDLVSDPLTHARALYDYIGLDWRDEFLHEMTSVERPIATASVWQVRQPISTGSIGKWKRYEKHMQSFIDALGDVR